MAHAHSHEVARQILQIVPLVMRMVSADLRHSEHCLIPAHFRLLGMLAHRPWSLSELADVQAVSLPTISSTITTLEERGWVARARSDQDRRVVIVAMTPEGRVIMDKAHRHAEERIAQVLARLSDEQRDTLLEGLMILRDAFASEPEMVAHRAGSSTVPFDVTHGA
jgi:DNA-binding MarR family transcriptional regulator